MSEEVKVRLTKKGVPDKRSLSSRTNAIKAREAKLKKQAQKKEIMIDDIQEENDSDSVNTDSESEDEEVKILREQLSTRVDVKAAKTTRSQSARGSGDRSSPFVAPTPQYKLEDIADTVAQSVTKTFKNAADEKKALAKAKRDAIKKAKAEGTYVPKPRGRPKKETTKTDVAVKEYVEMTGGGKAKDDVEETPKKAEQSCNSYISW